LPEGVARFVIGGFSGLFLGFCSLHN